MTTKASAYVKSNRLCIVGICDTEFGPIPFAASQTIEPVATDGQLNLFNESEDKAATVAGETALAVPDGQVDMNAPTESYPAQLVTALEQVQDKAMKYVDKEKIVLAAEELVRRARAGDQNAMGTLAMIGQSVSEGATAAKKAVMSFIKRNPFNAIEKGEFGLEPPRAIKLLDRQLSRAQKQSVQQWASTMSVMMPEYVKTNIERAVVIAADNHALLKPNGPEMKALVQAMPTEKAVNAFEFGRKLSATEFSKVEKEGRLLRLDPKYLRFGWVVGRAYRLQMVRKDGPISLISPMAAWELGE